MNRKYIQFAQGLLVCKTYTSTGGLISAKIMLCGPTRQARQGRQTGQVNRCTALTADIFAAVTNRTNTHCRTFGMHH
jgi:hypothetical protein